MKINKHIIPAIILLLIIFIIGGVKLYESKHELKKLITNTNINNIKANIKQFEAKFNLSFESVQESFVDINSAVQEAQGAQLIKGPYWSMAKDQLGKYHRLTENSDVEPRAEALKKLFDYTNKKGIKSLVALVPPSIKAGTTELPIGVEDYSNKLLDQFSSKIKSYGFPLLDMRESFNNDGLFNNDLYFKYDHHWTVQSAFKATNYVTDKLNEEFDLNLDPKKTYSNIDNYNVDILKNSYKGSIANALGSTVTGLDDFATIYPKFPTSFTNTQRNDESEITSKITGPFDVSLIMRDKIYNNSEKSFSAYIRNAVKQAEIVNNKADNKLKVLMITTSHGKPFSAFLSSYFKGLSFIDLQPGKFNKNVYKYIDEYKPDVVVLMYSAHTFGKKVLWEFDRK